MSDLAKPARSLEAETPENETRAGGVIDLPDPSQPGPPARSRRKGRHFGPRPVADPLDAWLPGCRCTKAQRAQADAAAAQAGISLNAYVRRTMFGTPGPRAQRRKRPDRNWALLAQMLAAQGRSGNNLNQLLRRMNSYDFRGIPELCEMVEAMKAAHAAHKELCEAIMAELKV